MGETDLGAVAGTPSGPIPSEFICASDIANTYCNNDFGSPLITNEGRFNSLIGIVSGAGTVLGATLLGGCNPAVPGVYARVTSGALDRTADQWRYLPQTHLNFMFKHIEIFYYSIFCFNTDYSFTQASMMIQMLLFIDQFIIN